MPPRRQHRRVKEGVGVFQPALAGQLERSRHESVVTLLDFSLSGGAARVI